MQTATSVHAAERRTIAFGPFMFDPASRLLWKDGVELSLPPRVLGVLALLLERSGELVTKQELIGAVWRDAFVTETSLAEAISVLRQTLGDDPQRPTYIQTLHRRGYRFVADVQGTVGRTLSPARAAAVAPRTETEPRLSAVVPWIITLFALLTAASAVWRYLNAVVPPPHAAVRFALALPAGVTVASTGGPIAVSDDGSLVAVAACNASGCGIYLRPLSQADATLVAGTAGGAAPFFSPDGRSIGYFSSGRLFTIVLSGGSPVAVAEAAEPLGAAWLRDGQIVFARSAAEGLFVAHSSGRGVEPLTTPGPADGGHRWPSAMPDGSAVVFTVDAPRDYAGAVSMRTRAWRRLLDDVSAVRAPIAGFVLAQRDNNLLASAIDPREMAIRGLPVPVASLEGSLAAPYFAMSRAGTLALAPPGAGAVQVVLDWAGELRRLVPPPQPALPR